MYGVWEGGCVWLHVQELRRRRRTGKVNWQVPTETTLKRLPHSLLCVLLQHAACQLFRPSLSFGVCVCVCVCVRFVERSGTCFVNTGGPCDVAAVPGAMRSQASSVYTTSHVDCVVVWPGV